MTSRLANVDDRDALIRYACTWTTAGVPVEFGGTTQWSSVAGSAASFTFIGERTLNMPGSIFMSHMDLHFRVRLRRKNRPCQYEFRSRQVHHGAMGAGPHTLVITQTVAQDQGIIYLDYLMYNTSSTSVSSYFIDDSDPAITYTPAWPAVASQDYFQHTARQSTSAGDSFSLHSEGKAISYHGGITPYMNASIAIDGGPPVFMVLNQ
ncbi:hypothetical protein DFH09DRAFT_1313005 [Mycena vulgaris]|nr:hypothetical protein DFH09DRAFT_1313005 [Mycena vulgaris]